MTRWQMMLEAIVAALAMTLVLVACAVLLILGGS